MCIGKVDNGSCPTACQFRLFNEDLGINEESLNAEAIGYSEGRV
jgi:hypothetical protein